eukprot:CAMPEP_0201970030 /NCGR_PEP_ID=MMETSP0904-20121228/26038_1 /ASSEMBLY_ACC=CAM_ASM_000553 /TAXON_ID=420261 /ORGANISM="Thalassiosira antarctica, Strain CCMP982" /LENGTH=192 /DNA_ID=CAMNT_0048518663 /DNA_START=8 /DNA_END=589 /DNA_ORIENTATION=-
MAPKKSTKAKGNAPASTASMVDPLFPPALDPLTLAERSAPLVATLDELSVCPSTCVSKGNASSYTKAEGVQTVEQLLSSRYYRHKRDDPNRHKETTMLLQQGTEMLQLGEEDIDCPHRVRCRPHRIKEKARLGTLVVQKTVDVMAFTGKNKEDETELKIFQEWDSVEIMGLTTQRAKSVVADVTKKDDSIKR